MTTKTRKGKPTIIGSVKKALQILDLFIEVQKPLGPTEISERLGLNFSTTHHIISTLQESGYLKQDIIRKKYTLGAKTLQLGLAAQEVFEQLGERSRSILDALADTVNEDVTLAILDGEEVVYVGKPSSAHATIRTFIRLGTREPLYCSTVGKVFLANMPREAARALFEAQNIQQKTQHTITRWDQMAQELDLVQEKGYAVDREETEEGVAGIAVPVKNYAGEVLVGLTISGLAGRILDNVEALSDAVKTCARDLSSELGYYGLHSFNSLQLNKNSVTKNSPIGIFDSGMGGFSVLKPLLTRLPKESVLYFGDTGRRPYGPRPAREIQKFVMEISQFLVDNGAKMIVIACNTASVSGEKEVKKRFSHTPVIGMVEAGVKASLRTTQAGKIAVLGTKCTVESGVIQKRIQELNPNAYVYSAATEELLRMAELGGEAGGFSKQTMQILARNALEPALEKGVDTVLLACTDFPCIAYILEEIVEDKAVIIDPANEVALEAERMLWERNLLCEEERPSSTKFFVSGDDLEDFNSFGRSFLEMNVSAMRVYS